MNKERMQLGEISTEKKPETSSRSNLFAAYFGEAIALTAVSALAYFSAYKFQAAYLKYFGVGEVFVEVDFARLVFALSAILPLIVFSCQMLNVVPIQIFRRGIEIFLVYPYVAVPFVFFLLVFYVSGFSKASVVLFLVNIVLCIFPIFGYVQRRRKGVQWSKVVESAILEEKSARRHLLGARIIDNDIGFLVLIFLSVLIFVGAFSAYAGENWASRRALYVQALIEDDNYAILSTFRDGVVAVEVGAESDLGRTPTGKVRFLEMRDLSEIGAMESDLSLRLNKFEAGAVETPEWVTFSEMLQWIGISETVRSVENQ